MKKSCTYCGNEIDTKKWGTYPSRANQEYCSNRCKYLMQGLNVTSPLGVYIQKHDMLMTEYVKLVQKYIDASARTIAEWVHNGVPHKKVRVGSLNAAYALVFAMMEMDEHIMLHGRMFDYRLLFKGGPHKESKTRLDGVRGCEVIKAIKMVPSKDMKAIAKSVVGARKEFLQRQGERLAQTNYTKRGNKLSQELCRVYKEWKEQYPKLVGESKEKCVLRLIQSRKVECDPMLAFVMSQYLVHEDMKVDYRLLMEPKSVRQLIEVRKGFLVEKVEV